MSHGRALRLLRKANVEGHSTGTGRGSIHIWKKDPAAAVLQADKDERDAKAAEADTRRRIQDAQPAPTAPSAPTRTAEPSNMFDVLAQLSRDQRRPVHLADEDRVALATLAASVQGTMVVTTDTREMLAASNREILIALGRYDSYLQLVVKGQTEISDQLAAVLEGLNRAEKARALAWAKLESLQAGVNALMAAATTPGANVLAAAVRNGHDDRPN